MRVKSEEMLKVRMLFDSIMCMVCRSQLRKGDSKLCTAIGLPIKEKYYFSEAVARYQVINLNSNSTSLEIRRSSVE